MKNPNHDKDFEDTPSPFAEECGLAILEQKRKEEQKTAVQKQPADDPDTNNLVDL